MTDEQIKLIKKPNSELTKEELDNATKMVANIKRAFEIAVLIPEALGEIREDVKAFCEKWDVDLEDKEVIRLILLPEREAERREMGKNPPKAGDSEEKIDEYFRRIPETYFRYYQYTQNKLRYRDILRDRVCVPSNEKIKLWRDRQVNRCQGAIGGNNGAFIHALTTFELADGCSVGCDFCGLSAGRLKQVFRYTEENAKLFREVLKVCHEIIGDAAGAGMMYFATEPLDNPDYELFEEDYHKEFGFIPQITTAVADRDVERTKRLLNELRIKRGGFIHRFTVRNLEMARNIFASFTADDLIHVELLPQYPEAPGFTPYSKVGKEAEKKDSEEFDSEENEVSSDPGTICCIDGFRINFCKKEISVFTPCHMSEENPNGIAVSCVLPFEDGDDFRKKMNYLIDEYMVLDVPKDEKLKIYDYFRLKYDKTKGNILQSIYGGETLLLDKFKEDYMREIIETLMESKYTKSEIASKLLKEHNVPAEHTHYFINQLWKKGYIVDTKFFSH